MERISALGCGCMLIVFTTVSFAILGYYIVSMLGSILLN